MVRRELVIIIPAFNEESTIQSVINSISEFGQVLIIDDGSTDKTAIRASSSGAIVHSHKHNLGYDDALNTGFRIAASRGFEYIITMDADGQHDSKSITKIRNLLSDGFDLVVASRRKKQRFSEEIFSFYSSLRWSINDPLSGFKGYRISLYHSLGHFDSYKSIGTELLFYALKNNYKVAEIEAEIKPRIGNSRFGDSLKTNFKILRAIFLSF